MELIPSYGGSCGDNLDDFFDEYVKPECRKDGLSGAYSFAHFYYCFFPSADYWFNIVKPYIDWECVGVNLYQKDNFSIDTTYLTDLVKNRYKVLARSEAYLYGSSRLGIDKDYYPILNDSLIQYHNSVGRGMNFRIIWAMYWRLLLIERLLLIPFLVVGMELIIIMQIYSRFRTTIHLAWFNQAGIGSGRIVLDFRSMVRKMRSGECRIMGLGCMIC